MFGRKLSVMMVVAVLSAVIGGVWYLSSDSMANDSTGNRGYLVGGPPKEEIQVVPVEPPAEPKVVEETPIVPAPVETQPAMIPQTVESEVPSEEVPSEEVPAEEVPVEEVAVEKKAVSTEAEPVAAAEKTPEAAVSPVPASVEQQGASAGESTEPEAPGMVTMDFKDADIHNVLRILAHKGDVNIIAGPEVNGLVTIRLTNVPWEKAMDVILRTYGFAYEREGNIIRVTTVGKLKEEDLSTEVFALNYCKSSEVAESVKEMVTERGKIRQDARTNTLIVTDIPTNIYRISQVVKRLDRKTPQILIEAKVVETTLVKGEDLGIDWTTTITAAGSSRPITAPFNRAGTLGKHGDSYYPLGSTGFPSATVPSFPYVTSTATSFAFGKLDFSQFQAVMEMLKSRTNTKLISNPRITTLNHQPAKILVGGQVGIPIYERVEGSVRASMEVSGYKYQDVGVKLVVTPHVNENNDIVLDLDPSISEQDGYDALTADINVPKFKTRQATTQVMLRDGETIVIGGLLKEKITDGRTRVPVLGSIPILSLVFSKKTQTVDNIDLIIFVTAHIVTDNAVAVQPVP